MFNDIGKKIKGLAVASTCLGIIASVFGGVALYVLSPVLCILIIAVGSLTAWLSSFMLYGLGHMIDMNDKIAYYSKHSYQKLYNIDEKLDGIRKSLNNNLSQ